LRVIVTGGGTGGHIYPAMAIARGLLTRHSGVEVLYVGLSQGMEARIVPANGLHFQGVSGKGLPRKISFSLLKAMGANILALGQTRRILKYFKPDLVLGTGGYVSGPVVLTAALSGIPALVHEQNAFPGKTNKFLAKFVKNILLTFPESAKYFSAEEKIRIVGLPVREEIGKIKRTEGAAAFSLDPRKKVLLVTGGSQGALHINQAMLYVLKKLDEHKNLGGHTDVQLIWATGPAGYDQIVGELKKEGLDHSRPEWVIVPYIEQMPEALACADLCICRAGATTLAELSAAGKAAILIPYPYAAENHQEYNAKAFVDKGAAVWIPDKDLTGTVLWEHVQKILFNAFLLEEMGARAQEMFPPDALDRILELCLRIARG